MDFSGNLTFEEYSSKFKIKIDSCVQKGDKIYYQIEMSSGSGHSWGVERTYQEFEDLHAKISVQTVGLPKLAPRHIFKLNETQIEERRLLLDKYLKDLSQRQDVCSTKYYVDFLGYIEQIPGRIETKELGKVGGDQSMSCLDAIYLEDRQILFVLLSETSLETKVKGFFHQLTNSSKSKKDVYGKIVAYRQKHLQEYENGSGVRNNNFEFQKIWEYALHQQPTCFIWDQGLTVLATGMHNGMINILRVKTEKNYQEFEEFCIIDRHLEAITGMVFDTRTANLYSISKDRNFIITNISLVDNPQLAQQRGDEKVFSDPLSRIVLDKENRVIYLGSSTGTIYMFEIDPKLNYVGNLVPQSKNNITSMILTSKSEFLIVTTQNGLIKVFQVQKKGREKNTQIISCIETDKHIRSVQFSRETREIIVAFNNSILLINSSKGTPVRTILQHHRPINALRFYKNSRLLVSSSEDSSVKFTRLRPVPEDETSAKSIQDQVETLSNRTTAKEISSELQQMKDKMLIARESDSESSDNDENFLKLRNKKPNQIKTVYQQ